MANPLTEVTNILLDVLGDKNFPSPLLSSLFLPLSSLLPSLTCSRQTSSGPFSSDIDHGVTIINSILLACLTAYPTSFLVVQTHNDYTNTPTTLQYFFLLSLRILRRLWTKLVHPPIFNKWLNPYHSFLFKTITHLFLDTKLNKLWVSSP